MKNKIIKYKNLVLNIFLKDLFNDFKITFIYNYKFKIFKKLITKIISFESIPYFSKTYYISSSSKLVSRYNSLIYFRTTWP